MGILQIVFVCSLFIIKTDLLVGSKTGSVEAPSKNDERISDGTLDGYAGKHLEKENRKIVTIGHKEDGSKADNLIDSDAAEMKDAKRGDAEMKNDENDNLVCEFITSLIEEYVPSEIDQEELDPLYRTVNEKVWLNHGGILEFGMITEIEMHGLATGKKRLGLE